MQPLEFTIQELHYIKAVITEVNNLKFTTLEKKIIIYGELLDKKFTRKKATYAFTETIHEIKR